MGLINGEAPAKEGRRTGAAGNMEASAPAGRPFLCGTKRSTLFHDDVLSPLPMDIGVPRDIGIMFPYKLYGRAMAVLPVLHACRVRQGHGIFWFFVALNVFLVSVMLWTYFTDPISRDPNVLTIPVLTVAITFGIWRAIHESNAEKASRAFPVFFHPDRREVLFLQWDSGGPAAAMRIVPWEEIAAVSYESISPVHHPKPQETVEPIVPEEWTYKMCTKVATELQIGVWKESRFLLSLSPSLVIPTRGDMDNRIQWQHIRAFMEGEPDVLNRYGAEELLGLFEEIEAGISNFMTPELEEWCQPSEPQQPSVKLRWYNAVIGKQLPGPDFSAFTELGIVEETIPYPGDDAAREQLATLREHAVLGGGESSV